MNTKFGLVRVVFGLVWGVDAILKWAPQIRGDILTVLAQAQDGQPAWEQAWIHLWVSIASIDPMLFGTFIALVETALALSLITGIASRYALYCGAVFSLIIWSVPQGFGGPYAWGSTDIDSGFVYFLVFVALILGQAWRSYSLSEKFGLSFLD